MTAPINQYLRLQGRQFALDLVESLGEQLYTPKGAADAITKLTAATQNKPESHAVGMRDIIEVLQKALSGPVRQDSANSCEGCAMDLATCDCVGATPAQSAMSPCSSCVTTIKEENHE
ncbi:hypothetical protein [Pseudomonas sp. NPDC096950]|uniref:hypothetical protein n=1 Tax=Pseudomonas sp. NPDC096950 TaxID=3364485 RepID=UPI00383BF3CF